MSTRPDPRSLIALVTLACLVSLPGCRDRPESDSWIERGSALLGGITRGEGEEKINVAEGLKEALRVGTETVAAQLGTTDGFNRDLAIRIPLPARLNTMRDKLKKFGLGGVFDDLETRLNRAAETAAPKAKKIFWQSISEMTLTDAAGIFNGPEDAATQYFRGKMTPRLEQDLRPVIVSSLSKVGAVQKYEQIVSLYKRIPGAPDVAPDLKTQLANHTLDGALNGIFHYLAIEEAAIRRDPAKRTTKLLRTVFGARF